jgi:hypothetical protein
MRAQEYPVEHFKFMSELASSLIPIPIQIMEHHYHYESFGSWVFTCRYKGKEYRVVYDGKDGCFSMQKQKGPDWEEIKTVQQDLSASAALKFILETLNLLQ